MRKQKKTGLKPVHEFRVSPLVSVIDLEGQLFVNDEGLQYQYLHYFLAAKSNRKNTDWLTNAEIDLKEYRKSLIRQAKCVDPRIYRMIYADATENVMYEYLYRNEGISKNVADVIWQFIPYHSESLISEFIQDNQYDIASEMIKRLKKLESGRDMNAIYPPIRKAMQERFMKNDGRTRLQEALKKLEKERG